MQGEHDKEPIMALVSRETGEVRSQVMPNVKAQNLRAVLHEHVEAAATHLHTDSSLGYRRLLASSHPIQRSITTSVST